MPTELRKRAVAFVHAGESPIASVCKFVTFRKEFRELTISHLRRMQKPPALIMNFLESPTTRYAAW